MIFIAIQEADLEAANTFTKETFHETGNSFVVNKTDGENNYCLISLPNNGSAFNQTLIDQFGVYEEDPRRVLITPPALLAEVAAVREWNIRHIGNRPQVIARAPAILVDAMVEPLEDPFPVDDVDRELI
jgi:hypothetical protein